MYKVLLVDDEPMIREGLRSLIDWEEFGYQVVDTAANGREALEKHEQLRPDLMIIDIRMPGMDGLTLIGHLREVNANLHILILSGYADFDYAKKAIQYQIDGYLLKPVDEDELTGYLDRLRTVLAQEAEVNRRHSAMNEWNRERLIQVCLEGIATEEEAIQVREAARNAGLDWTDYDLLLVKLQAQEGLETGAFAYIKRRFVTNLEDTGRGIVFYAEPYIGLLLKEPLRTDHQRSKLYQEISDIAAERELAFTAVSGGAVADITELVRSYANAVRVMNMRFFYKEGQILHEDTPSIEQLLPDPDSDSEPFDLDTMSDKLYFALDIGNDKAACELVRESGGSMLQANYTEQEIKTGIVQLVTGAVGKLTLHRPELQERRHELSNGIIELYKPYSFQTLIESVEALLLRAMDGLDAGGTDKQIMKMIDLIQRNYQQPLKLETLADVLGYNSAYLGKLFKSTTGEYFNSYLDKVRIEKAKSFLEQGMKVYQVAEKVGYTNVDYFHSKFRKYVGESPSAYKKK
ncbi:two-component system response regulator YesN [Paenibacillus phyllosphaerae]|uniref:Two-component system response regulator YesN n=1 Tax=Paenibacillus phyllosphaerae TaxID=274593 RepID=A0A7W5AVW7_9BACL|nr:response regulator transcription factor [Paenibacillus phyllosphaerae]MBB3109547.1 two-component system response regulator YesN [Paenibacillus phyllosphaerae]